MTDCIPVLCSLLSVVIVWIVVKNIQYIIAVHTVYEVLCELEIDGISFYSLSLKKETPQEKIVRTR